MKKLSVKEVVSSCKDTFVVSKAMPTAKLDKLWKMEQ